MICMKRIIITINVTSTNRIEKLDMKFKILTLVIKLSNGKKTNPIIARITFSIL